jgi:hypothetical protein
MTDPSNTDPSNTEPLVTDPVVAERARHQNLQPGAPSGGGMATAALVLGILSIFASITVIGGVLLGVLAVIFGAIAVRRARLGAPGRGRAMAGIVTGVIGVLLAAALIAFGVSLLNSDKVKNLESCLKDAHGDQAKVQQCQDQYRQQNSGG